MDTETRAAIMERSRQIDISLSFPPVGDVLLRELRRRQAKPPETVETPFPSWNRACRGEGGGRGLAAGWYVLVAGLTGAGKTLLALNLVASALRQGVNVLYFSLEMSWEQLVTRLRPIIAGGEVTHTEWGAYFDPEQAKAADDAILELPGTLYVNTEPIWKLEDIRDAMEYAHRADGVRLFVVDYAQLVEPSGSDRALFEAMASISSQLRFMAQHLRVVTVALSQLNRAATRERKAPPTIDGLFGSARFGFDADQVLALDYSTLERDAERRLENTQILLLKNRHGPQVTIPIQFNYGTLQARELLPHEGPSDAVGR